MHCLQDGWSAGSISELGQQLHRQLAVTRTQRTRGGASWPHQMPYSRVQLMPHAVHHQFNVTNKISWFQMSSTLPSIQQNQHLMLIIYFPKCTSYGLICSCWGQPDHRLQAFCKEFQIGTLFGSDTVQMVTLITPFYQCELRQHLWGLEG